MWQVCAVIFSAQAMLHAPAAICGARYEDQIMNATASGGAHPSYENCEG
jgi:hypothetical protein